VLKVFVGLFVLGFFAYLFGPLIIMSITAFNSSAFPRVMPFECFSVEWFDVLVRDENLMRGLRNSLWIGLGVVLISVPVGLAGGLMLTQVAPRVRAWYYTIVVSPILIPGVVLGISTIVFWDRVAAMFGLEYESIFYQNVFGHGIFLTIIGQSTFISAYCMLVFISRLQRFDPAQEEAALDLGASHVQTFRKVLLPFLKPAIGSAAVLAFLASFENYNTTVFTIISESTLTTVLASKVRYGINPSISALAVVIVGITLFGAALHEVMKRREAAAAQESARMARGEITERRRAAHFLADPATILVVLVFCAGLGTAYFAGTLGVEECKTAAKAERQRITDQRVKEQRMRQMFKRAAPSEQTGTGAGAGSTAPEVKAKGAEGYQGIFAPGNLKGQVEGEQPTPAPAPTPDGGAQAPGTEGYQGIFAPGNLKGQVEGQQPSPAPAPAPDGGAQAPGTEGYRGMFAPGNLKGQVGTEPAPSTESQ
jgi:spermidine/putrescine transport system permease protein